MATAIQERRLCSIYRDKVHACLTSKNRRHFLLFHSAYFHEHPERWAHSKSSMDSSSRQESYIKQIAGSFSVDSINQDSMCSGIAQLECVFDLFRHRGTRLLFTMSPIDAEQEPMMIRDDVTRELKSSNCHVPSHTAPINDNDET